MSEKYLVSVYVAAPGTPLKEGGTSLPGHMFYETQHGDDKRSFGLAPVKHGDTNGPGRVYTNDASNYVDPRYVRTIEISKEQYDKLNAFGAKPSEFGFNTYYKDVRNNCVDFTWGALNSAGLHATRKPWFTGDAAPDKTQEGSLKPLRNIDDIQSIKSPFPASPLNREQFNPMPERTIMQRMFSDSLPQPKDALLAQVRDKTPLDQISDERDYANVTNALADAARRKGLTVVEEIRLGSMTENNGQSYWIRGVPINVLAHLGAEAAFRGPQDTVAPSEQTVKRSDPTFESQKLQQPSMQSSLS
jgi:hypothetical protein